MANLRDHQLKMDKLNNEVSRLRLRQGNRSAPYVQIIREFFPDKPELIGEHLSCKCGHCGKEFNNVATAVVAPIV
jgi:hypothetical protein